MLVELEAFWEEYWLVTTIFVVLGSILAFFIHNDPQRRADRLRRWRGKMVADARRAYLISRVADHVTDALVDDQFKDRITPAEARSLYAEIGSKLGIRDLCPGNGEQSLALLKREIKHRLNSTKFYRDENDKRIVVNLP